MKRWKKVLKVILAVLGVLLVWFVLVRATSGNRAVTFSGEGEFAGEWRGSLRVGCYNIAHGRGSKPDGSNWDGGSEDARKERLAEVAELIRAQDLDLVVLNEVDFDCTWSHGVNQARALAEACDYSFVAEQRNLDLGLPMFRVAIGNAILSRFPTRKLEGVEYPAVKWWEPVVAGRKDGMKATVELPDGSELEVFAVHAETRSATVRKESVKVLMEEAGSRSILAGDFNSIRRGDGSTAVDLLSQDGRWKEVAVDDATYPTKSPERRIDWIFVPRGWEELTSKVIVSELSDHAMVVGEWKVN